MWSADDVRSFYGKYAARYDEEIEADPDSYPGPDKIAGWMLSYFELCGCLPSARTRLSTTGNATARPSAAPIEIFTCIGMTDEGNRRLAHVGIAQGDAIGGENGLRSEDKTPTAVGVLLCQDKVHSGCISAACPPRQGYRKVAERKYPKPVGDEKPDGAWNGFPRSAPKYCGESEGTGALPPTMIEILDLGCGTGRSSRLFFEHPFGADRLRLTGFDATPEMLEKARVLPFHALHCRNIEQPLDIPPNSYDAVVCVGVMDFIALPKAFLEQVARILRPHGVFGVTLPERRLTATAAAAAGHADWKEQCGGMAGSTEVEKDELSSFEWAEADDLVSSAGFRIHRRERFLGYVDSITGAKTHYYGYLLSLA